MKDVLKKHSDILYSYTKIPAVGDSEESQLHLNDVRKLLPQCRDETQKLVRLVIGVQVP